jgi:hypothetical protein
VDEQNERDALAHLCADLKRLRGLLRGPSGERARVIVEQAVRAARRGEPVGPLVSLLTPASAPLRYGYSRGATPPPLSKIRLPPVVGEYGCPLDVCSRLESRRPGCPVPSCDVHEQALRFLPDEGADR